MATRVRQTPPGSERFHRHSAKMNYTVGPVGRPISRHSGPGCRRAPGNRAMLRRFLADFRSGEALRRTPLTKPARELRQRRLTQIGNNDTINISGNTGGTTTNVYTAGTGDTVNISATSSLSTTNVAGAGTHTSVIIGGSGLSLAAINGLIDVTGRRRTPMASTFTTKITRRLAFTS